MAEAAMHLGIDEAHFESWTFSAGLARIATPEMPEYSFLGHIKDLATAVLNAEVHINRLPLSPTVLRAYDVLMIASPSRRGVEPVFGDEDHFSDVEAEAVGSFVSAGGGLLILGEHEASFRTGEINSLFGAFGITFDPRLAHATDLARSDAQVATDDFTCLPTDWLAERCPDIQRVSFHRGCTLNLSGSAVPLLCAPNGATVAACTEFGKGRALFVGDSDMFALPFIGRYDNASFVVFALQWLAQLNTTPSPTAAIRSFVQRAKYPWSTVSTTDDVPHVSLNGDTSWTSLASKWQGLDRGDLSIAPEASQIFTDLETASHSYPDDLRSSLVEFRRVGNASGALVVHGLSTSDFSTSPTPPAGNARKEGPLMPFEWQLLAIGALLGDPFSYAQEKSGLLLQDIVPAKEFATALSSSSSATELTFHTEAAFHPFMPCYVLLACVRNSPCGGGRTSVASVREALQALPIGLRPKLFESLYRTELEPEFHDWSAPPGGGRELPILYGNPYDPLMRVDVELMHPVGAGACEAMKRLVEALEVSRRTILLEPGEAVVIDNRRTVHGRSPFEANYDGADRWLVRLLVSRDLTIVDERGQRNRHMITMQFSAGGADFYGGAVPEVAPA